MSNFFPRQNTKNVLEAERGLSQILVESGKLKPSDVARIIAVQEQEGIRFAEAAMALDMVTQDDLNLALSGQAEYSFLDPEESGLSLELISVYQPSAQATETIHAIQNQLMTRWFKANENNSLAVVSAGKGDGRSYFVANLAVVFSQLGMRTLLIDADLRNPRQHLIFNLPNNVGLSNILAGRREEIPSTKLHYFSNLSVLVSGPISPNPLVLLNRGEFKQLVSDATEKFDVVLLDTPSAEQYYDTQLIASLSRAAIVITRKHQTRLRPTNNLVSSLRKSGVEIVGVVANLSVSQTLWDTRFKDYLYNSILVKIVPYWDRIRGKANTSKEITINKG